MKRFRSTASSSILAALLGLSGAASANVIDLFSQPTPGAQAVGVGGFSDALPDASEYFANDGSIIGNYRDLALVNVSGTSTVNGSTLAVADGRLSFANAPNVKSTAVVQWDGGPEATPGVLQYGLNADLVNQTGCPISGCTYFAAKVFDADQGFAIELGVYTDADEYSLLRFISTAVPGESTSIFSFSWFDIAGLGQEVEPGFFIDVIHGAGGKADFTNVNALELRIGNSGGNAAIDLEIGAIKKYGVPEPGGLALAGLALLGLAASRRGRRQ